MRNYLQKAIEWLVDDSWKKIRKFRIKKEKKKLRRIDIQLQTTEGSVWSCGKEKLRKIIRSSIEILGYIVYYAREILGYIVYYASLNWKYLIAGCSGIVLVIGFCLYHGYSIGYLVSTEEEPLFIVSKEENVYNVIDQMTSDLKQEFGVDVDFESELSFKKSFVRKSKIYSEEQIENCLSERLGNRVHAVAIVVNGTPQIYLPDQESAEKVLKELTESGTVVAEGETLKGVTIKEDIEIQDCQVAIRNLNSIDSALELIRLGEEKPVIYTVKSGDTLWTIARANDMLIDKITTINNINENEILSIGQELILSKCDPLISVVATVERQETEPIPFETELKEDNSVNGIQIAQEGENGEKVVSYATTRVNGVTTEEYITNEEVTKEATSRVVLRGSQVTLASRGLTQSVGVYSGSGRLMYPTQGTITQYFTGSHTGVDIANNMGTNIVAAGDGIVTYVQYSNYSYGNYVVIDHLNGILTRYAHCSKLYVNIGDSVKAGQSIAAMGSTGNSTGPHLHFEVLVNGAFVNPLSYL